MKDGVVLPGNLLKVYSFINHQALDMMIQDQKQSSLMPAKQNYSTELGVFGKRAVGPRTIGMSWSLEVFSLCAFHPSTVIRFWDYTSLGFSEPLRGRHWLDGHVRAIVGPCFCWLWHSESPDSTDWRSTSSPCSVLVFRGWAIHFTSSFRKRVLTCFNSRVLPRSHTWSFVLKGGLSLASAIGVCARDAWEWLDGDGNNVQRTFWELYQEEKARPLRYERAAATSKKPPQPF